MSYRIGRYPYLLQLNFFSYGAFVWLHFGYGANPYHFSRWFTLWYSPSRYQEFNRQWYER